MQGDRTELARRDTGSGQVCQAHLQPAGRSVAGSRRDAIGSFADAVVVSTSTRVLSTWSPSG